MNIKKIHWQLLTAADVSFFCGFWTMKGEYIVLKNRVLTDVDLTNSGCVNIDGSTTSIDKGFDKATRYFTNKNT